jgi:hypothetical protein
VTTWNLHVSIVRFRALQSGIHQPKGTEMIRQVDDLLLTLTPDTVWLCTVIG